MNEPDKDTNSWVGLVVRLKSGSFPMTVFEELDGESGEGGKVLGCMWYDKGIGDFKKLHSPKSLLQLDLLNIDGEPREESGRWEFVPTGKTVLFLDHQVMPYTLGKQGAGGSIGNAYVYTTATTTAPATTLLPISGLPKWGHANSKAWDLGPEHTTDPDSWGK